jgi:uncharacterized membrane protein YdjX (TVP38/TMEM64 family)
MHRRALVAGGLLAVVLAASLLVSPAATLARLDALADDPVRFGVAIALCYAIRPFVAWPTTLVAVAVGYGFGVVYGLPIALAGAVVTSIPPFVAGRYFGTDDGNPLAWFAPGDRFLDAASAYFDATGDFRGVTAARLAPIPADAVTATAGMTRVSPLAFAAATVVGELPWTLAALLVGQSLDSLTAGGVTAVDPRLVLGLAIAAAIVLAGPLFQRVAVGD